MLVPVNSKGRPVSLAALAARFSSNAGHIYSIDEISHEIYSDILNRLDLWSAIQTVVDLALFALGFRLSHSILFSRVRLIFNEGAKRKNKIKALYPPIRLIPKSLHPNKLAA